MKEVGVKEWLGRKEGNEGVMLLLKGRGWVGVYEECGSVTWEGMWEGSKGMSRKSD